MAKPKKGAPKRKKLSLAGYSRQQAQLQLKPERIAIRGLRNLAATQAAHAAAQESASFAAERAKQAGEAATQAQATTAGAGQLASLMSNIYGQSAAQQQQLASGYAQTLGGTTPAASDAYLRGALPGGLQATQAATVPGAILGQAQTQIGGIRRREQLGYQELGRQQAQARQKRADALAERNQALDAQLAQVVAKTPGVAQDILRNERTFLQTARQNRFENWSKIQALKLQAGALGVQSGYLGLAGKKFKLDAADYLSGVSGYQYNPDGSLKLDKNGNPIPVAPKPLTPAQRAAAQKSRASAIKAREQAFGSAHEKMLTTAKSFYTTKTVPGKTILDEPTKQKVPWTYKRAYGYLWNKYSHLINQYSGPGQGRAAMKRRLRKSIDSALAAQGIRPGKKLTPKQKAKKGISQVGQDITSIFG